MEFEQPVGEVDAEIGIDPDQIGVESSVMNFRQRQTIRNDRLTQLLIGIHDDVSGIEQPRFGQMGDRAPPPAGAQDGISKRCLVQASL